MQKSTLQNLSNLINPLGAVVVVFFFFRRGRRTDHRKRDVLNSSGAGVYVKWFYGPWGTGEKIEFDTDEPNKRDVSASTSSIHSPVSFWLLSWGCFFANCWGECFGQGVWRFKFPLVDFSWCSLQKTSWLEWITWFVLIVCWNWSQYWFLRFCLALRMGFLSTKDNKSN